MIRMTQQRRAIRGALEQANRPLTPTEIRQEAGEVSLTTVYRNPKAMMVSGGNHAVEVVGQPPRHELSGLAHHHHFLCESGDRLFDVPGCPGSFEHLAPGGFTVTGHALMLTGHCAACQQAQPRPTHTEARQFKILHNRDGARGHFAPLTLSRDTPSPHSPQRAPK